MSGVSTHRSVGDPVLARLARIGGDPQDDTRASKALLVLISVLILPVALLWAALYAAIVVFSPTRHVGKFLRVGQVAIAITHQERSGTSTT